MIYQSIHVHDTINRYDFNIFTSRNHLNDIENIIPYVLVGGLYVLTKPDPTTAMWHFRAFTMARIAHTFVYQVTMSSIAIVDY